MNKENTILLTFFKIHMYERCSHVIGTKPIYIQTFLQDIKLPRMCKGLGGSFPVQFQNPDNSTIN